MPPAVKKISDMTVEDLHALAEAHYPEKKKKIIAEFDEQKQNIIARLEYELAVVDLMGFN